MSSGSRLNAVSSLNNRLKGSKGASSIDAASKHRSRIIPSSNSRNSAATHHHPDERRVFNSEGVDVTPRPLLRGRDDPFLRPDGNLAGGSFMNQTGEIRMQAQAPGRMKTTQFQGVPGAPEDDEKNPLQGSMDLKKYPNMPSTLHSSSATGTTSGESSRPGGRPPPLRKAGTVKDMQTGGGRSGAIPAMTAMLSPTAAGRAQQLQAEEQLPVALQLRETQTDVYFSLRGLTVAMDSKEKVKVEARNAHYVSLAELKQYKDRYSEDHSQTCNPLVKHKQAQAAQASTREVGCTSAGWEIYDASVSEVTDEEDVSRQAGSVGFQNPEMAAKVEEMVRLSLVSRGCLLSVDEGNRRGTQAKARAMQGEADEDAGSILAREKAEKVMKSSHLRKSLALVEMAVQQNLNAPVHARYRNLPTVQEVDEWWAPKLRAAAPEAAASTPATRKLQTMAASKFTTFSPGKKEGGARPSVTVAGMTTAATHRLSIRSNAEPEQQLQSGRETLAGTTTTSSSLDGSTAFGATEAMGGGSGQVKRAMEKLWDFNCTALTVGREVTCMAWSTARAPSKASITQVAEDLLAVGYTTDANELSVLSKGLVLFWSIRNHQYPERIIKTPTGVTALAFSRAHPSLLAVGLADGVVAIYDTGRDEDFDTPMLESSGLSDSSHDPIWQLRWVERQDRTERLVSVCNDGRVMEWDMKKGLSCQPIMVLKRSGEVTGLLSSYAFGLCFDFLPSDSSLYLAGTEDGMVLRCSCSYNEQYLEAHEAHMGPVYAIRFSPFARDMYLTAGGDWGLKVWREDSNRPVHSIQSSALNEIIYDADWSPLHETVLAAVTGDGKVLIWDLSKSLMDPVVTYTHYKNADFIADLEAQAVSAKVDPVSRRNTLLKAALAAQRLVNRVGGEADAENDMGRANSVSTAQSSSSSHRLQSGVKPGADRRGSATAPPAGRAPVAVMAKQLAQCTCLAFLETADILATGTSTGVVELFRLVGFDDKVKAHGGLEEGDEDEEEDMLLEEDEEEEGEESQAEELVGESVSGSSNFDHGLRRKSVDARGSLLKGLFRAGPVVQE